MGLCTGNVIDYRIKTNVCDCWFDGDYVVSALAVNNYMKSCYKKRQISIMPTYRRISYLPAGLGGSFGCAVRLETRRSRVQPPPRSATFFRGD